MRFGPGNRPSDISDREREHDSHVLLRRRRLPQSDIQERRRNEAVLGKPVTDAEMEASGSRLIAGLKADKRSRAVADLLGDDDDERKHAAKFHSFQPLFKRWS